MCWVELVVVGTEESPAAGDMVTGPWTAGAKVVKQHWIPESRDYRRRQRYAGQRPRPVGSCEPKRFKCGHAWRWVEEIGARSFACGVYI